MLRVSYVTNRREAGFKSYYRTNAYFVFVFFFVCFFFLTCKHDIYFFDNYVHDSRSHTVEGSVTSIRLSQKVDTYALTMDPNASSLVSMYRRLVDLFIEMFALKKKEVERNASER